jgi:restriction system protein
MPRYALCLALFCVAAQSARAMQLGETKEHLLAQHGAPGAEDHARNLAAYFWEGWSAQLEFEGNVVRKLTYRRNWYLQESEITSLLESNGGASHWREISDSKALARQWTRDDGASATCARTRPLSIVFQAAGLAAAYQQGPKVIVPGTPGPAAAKTSTFPKALSAVPEPDLPVADVPPPTSSLVPPPQALPKLQASELAPEAKPAPAVEPVPAPVATSENKPGIEPPTAATPAKESHTVGYILGSILLLGTLGGGGFYFLKRQPRPGKSLSMKARTPVSSGNTADAGPGLGSLRNDQVELLIGEIFRREGYTIELSAAVNTEDGIDLMLRRDSETTLVQCKHWKAPRVTAREVREFYGTMAAGGTPRGIFVTTGMFTPDATSFAPDKGIELIDGAALAAKIAAVAKPGENLCAVSSWIEDFTAHARIFDPECPTCHGTMIIHHNRASGAPSWNCRSYPRCPGRREPRLDLLPAPATH